LNLIQKLLALSRWLFNDDSRYFSKSRASLRSLKWFLIISFYGSLFLVVT